MLQAVRNQSVPPPPATRAFAFGHLSGFLALNAIYDQYATFFPTHAGSRHAHPEIAYGVAFARGISEAFQSSFLFDRKRFLDAYPDSDAKEAGIALGEKAADAVIRKRINDGAEPNQAQFYLGRYARREDALRWSPTGPFYGAEYGPAFNNFARGLLPGWGDQVPWVMRDKKRFLAVEFPDQSSREFARQYIKVKQLGGNESTVRTADQTKIAFFWEDGPRGVTPPGHWQIIAMSLLQRYQLSLLDQARMMALLSLAQADAAITCWDSKYVYDIIRPETAIRTRTDAFNNPYLRNQQDSDWQSLIPTPPFPAYTSGHSTFSGTSARMLALCIGRDDIRFSGSSPDLVNWPEQLTGVTRHWSSLWQAAEEGGASREYGGIHWESDNKEGLRVGRELADYVFTHAFKRKA